MLIKYQPKQDHILTVPLTLPVKAGEDLKKLKLEREQVQLVPGINEVPDDEWTLMKAYLGNKITAGIVSPIEKKVKNAKSGVEETVHDLKGVPAKEAGALIVGCHNPDTLKKWYQEETREELRLLIIEKMKELKIDIPRFDFEKITEEKI